MKINFVIGIVVSVAVGLRAESLRVVSSGPEEVELEWVLESVQVVERILDGQRFDDLAGAGEVRLAQAGRPALPYVAELLAAPAGAQVHLEVRPLHYRDFRDVFFVPAAHYNADEPDVPVYAPGPEYGENAFFPARQAAVEAVGILRGVEAYALHVYPYSYNPVQRVLRVCDRMEIRVRFTGGRAKAGGVGEDPHGGVFHQAFINPLHAVPRRRGSAKRAADWYDPAAPWVKIFVEQDGLQRLDVETLDKLVDTAEIDPRTLRVIYQGQEQLVRVAGAVDGRFNGVDYLLFHGFSRRDGKDFESPFGRRNTYWLTWGGDPGLRLEERSAAPVNGYPAQRSFWTTAHFEQDIWHDPLGLLDLEYGTLFTNGNSRDHWFWDRPIKTGDVLGSGLFFGELESPDTHQDYTARLRIALHGATGWGHHTMVQLNNRKSDDRMVDESFWEGQSELRFESEISPTWLNRGRNRLLLKVFADQEPGVDWIYFNWFEIDYLRLYQAYFDYLAFVQPPSDGHRITITGFTHATIEIFDVLNGIRFTKLKIDSVGDGFAATFEDRLRRPTLYVAGDRSNARRPLVQLDRASALRSADHEVDYLIVTHRRFLNPARTLADHRREAGLAVEVVEVQDIYDEFSHGLLDSDALRDFVDYAYHNWRRPPAYLLLLGDATFDYRNILGGSETSFVPSQYYHDRERGRSPSDYFYALVDGDDLLADLAVGRLPVENTRQARDVVEKIMRYDQDPEPGDWRSRVLYLANYHEKNIFTGPSDSLGAHYTEPLGLSSVKVYNPDESSIPNRTGKEFVDALNNGALLVNYSGHGSVGTMQPIFSLVAEDWDYFSQVQNDARLPLVLAFSCLNGLFTHQKDNLQSLAEVFTRKADGGAIAYISATAKSFVSQNDLLGDRLFNQFFKEDQLQLGPSLNAAKSQVLAAHSSWLTMALTMQLFGDPAQQLALPRTADYTPLSLDVGSGPIFGHSTLTVAATLKNSARLTDDSLTVALLGYAEASARPETLFYAARGPFAGVVDFSFSWPVRDRRGAYRLELLLDPEDRVAELYKNNNSLQLDLEILEPLVPTAIFPAANAVLPARDVALEAAVDGAAASEGSALREPSSSSRTAYTRDAIAKLQLDSWWPTMERDAAKWVATCSVCRFCKPQLGVIAETRMEFYNRPFHTLIIGSIWGP